QDGRWRDRRDGRAPRRAYRPRHRGHVSGDGDRQLRGPLRHSDRAPRAERGCLRPARLVRLLVRQRLLGRQHRDQPVRRSQKGEDAHGGDVMTKTFKALSALLSYPTEALRQAARECWEAIESERLLPAAVRRELDVLIE